jgi:hypothetical protein
MATNSWAAAVIVLGKRGYGKTTWLNKYAERFPRIFVFDPFRTFPADYLTCDEIISRLESKWFQETPRYRVGSNVIDDLEVLGSASFLTGKCCLIIEECGIAFYKGERIPEWLQEAVFLGRQQELNYVMTSQRAASIPIELRSQANRFISFRQTEKRDLEWTRDYLGEHYEELPNLDELECLDSDGKIVSRYRISPMGN